MREDEDGFEHIGNAVKRVYETAIMGRVLIEVSKLGARVWRNNIGAYKDGTGRLVKYGVCNPGGADIIGIYQGRFLAIEVKTPGGKLTAAQSNFLEQIRRNGGIAVVCDDEKKLKSLLDSAVECVQTRHNQGG